MTVQCNIVCLLCRSQNDSVDNDGKQGFVILHLCLQTINPFYNAKSTYCFVLSQMCDQRVGQRQRVDLLMKLASNSNCCEQN